MYPVVRIQSSRAQALEDLGTKAKFWYLEGDTRMLFKAEERGTGEDWAEKITCELAALLGLPHVHYEMAHDVDQDRPGVVCASLVPPPLALAHGNQLLLALDPDYPGAQGPHYRSRAHTIDAVFDVVRRLRMPTAGWCVNLPDGIDDAAGVFAGYLLLDAWVANQDRHHENWGAVWDGQHLLLAPSFDHGAALARNLSDAERAERLASRDHHRQVAHFVRRARSALYADAVAPSPLSTLEAWRAWAQRVPKAARAWQERLDGVESEAVADILEQIQPERMSAICRQFTAELLAQNRRRILQPEEP